MDIGIIGGTDGPTKIFIATPAIFFVLAAVIVAAVIAVLLLRKNKKR